jgi:hypothetical protein
VTDFTSSGVSASSAFSLLPAMIRGKSGNPELLFSHLGDSHHAMASADKITDDQRQKIIKTLLACLDKEGRQIQMASVGTLRQMGKAAASALPALETLEQSEADARIRNMVKGAIDQIRSGSDAAAAADETKRVREEVETLRKNQKALQDRLDKLEKGERKEKP